MTTLPGGVPDPGDGPPVHLATKIPLNRHGGFGVQVRERFIEDHDGSSAE